MRGMPPARILTWQPSLANNPFVANTGYFEKKKQIDPACAQSSAHTMMIPLSGIGLSADDSNNRLGSTRSGKALLPFLLMCR